MTIFNSIIKLDLHIFFSCSDYLLSFVDSTLSESNLKQIVDSPLPKMYAYNNSLSRNRKRKRQGKHSKKKRKAPANTGRAPWHLSWPPYALMAIVGISFPCHVSSSPALAFCLSLSYPELGGIRMQTHTHTHTWKLRIHALVAVHERPGTNLGRRVALALISRFLTCTIPILATPHQNQKPFFNIFSLILFVIRSNFTRKMPFLGQTLSSLDSYRHCGYGCRVWVLLF